jgi:Carboxypeptidase regulatory-like domain
MLACKWNCHSWCLYLLALFCALACSGGAPTPATYSISGTVSGVTASGVTVALAGGSTASTTTDGSGQYTFSGLSNGSYTVTPSLSGYVIAPTHIPVTVSGANVTKQDFTATAVECMNPVWSTDEATGTDSLGGSGTWWIDNDAWSGSHGPQTLYVCNQSSWYAVSDQADVQGQVETYPDTEYDIGGRDNGLPTKTIAQYQSITSTFSEAFPSAGSWDAAYDLWLNNWGTEIMIWNEWAGTQLYWPPSGAQALNLNGLPYHFYNNGGELMFFRDTMVKSGSVDILAAMNWLVSQGLVKSTDVPTQLEYGVEICSTSGSETFPLTGLTFDLN